MRFVAIVFSIMALFGPLAAQAAEPVRRAFIVGVERYRDGDIQSLTRANTDAKDIGRDLEQAGFDKKNVTVVTDVASKADFNKKFDVFLKTVKEGDFVLFYFSGHGVGVETENANYLLFGDLKSPVTFAREKLPAAERKDVNVVRTKLPDFLDAYTNEQVPKDGVSVREIERRLAERKPSGAFLVLDACRTILRADPAEERKVARSSASGSRLVDYKEPSEGTLVFFSASFGEQAVESFDESDRRRNSLFAEVFRYEMLRPGQSLVELSERVSRVVKAYALHKGRQQEPEFFASPSSNADSFLLVDTIGERRFALKLDRCDGVKDEWDRVVARPGIEEVDRHIRRFDGCDTVEEARRLRVGLVESPTFVGGPAVVVGNRQVDPCDRLAASDSDRDRPSQVSGVPLPAIDADAAIAACTDSIAKNPRVVRFLFNLGRARMAKAAAFHPTTQKRERTEMYGLARIAFEDAERRGHVAGIYNLGVLYDLGLGVAPDQKRASDLFKRAAQQNFPLAMYALALRYISGETDVQTDTVQAYSWFAKASEAGLIDATVQVGRMLWVGTGVANNPRRAVEALQRGADAGSVVAQHWLGRFLYFGMQSTDPARSVSQDASAALLWFGRAAEANDPTSQLWLAQLLEAGTGLPAPQPEIAERYWRLAAYSGYQDAEIEFADRLKRGAVLAKPENGDREAEQLWQRAFSQQSARAALALARAYRRGEMGVERDPLKAVRYAFQAIKFAVAADPLSNDGKPFNEFAAGHLLAEMAAAGEATTADGKPMFSKDEVERIEKFYGKVDPATKEVKALRLSVALTCFRSGTEKSGYNRISASRKSDFWVWDWGREEAPTEAQIRYLQHNSYCSDDNRELRETLKASFEQAKKNKVAFADLIVQQIRSAVAAAATEENRKSRR